MIKLRREFNMNVLSAPERSQIVGYTYPISICIFGAYTSLILLPGSIVSMGITKKKNTSKAIIL